MDYKLGVIGLGHWFGWLKTGLGDEGKLNLKKAVGTKPYESKEQLLRSFGIDRENYFMSDGKGNVPEQFFADLDLVHISDPNRFHALQATEALQHGKYVIVEKTLATKKSEFGRMRSYIRKNKYEDKIYLHLHYLHKQPTIALRKALTRLIRQYGKIRSINATFFEQVNGEDTKRTWVLDMHNGGIFMDWIHPYEIIYYATRCKFGDIIGLKNFILNSSYSNDNPTGIEARVGLSGKNYMEGAIATVRVAKGTPEQYKCKCMLVNFESGNRARLIFPGHESEFNNSSDRGKLEILDKNNQRLMSESLNGPNSSELFIKEVMDFCNGNHVGLKLNDIRKIFKPQWEYQKLSKKIEPVRDEREIRQYLDDGIKLIDAA
jgi:Oxidoreductase family, NAD-binding Rossmann fold